MTRTLLASSVLATAIAGLAHAQPLASGTPGQPSFSCPVCAGITPIMVNIRVLSGTLKVGDPRTTPVVSFDYLTGVAGLFAATFTFTSPSGTQAIQLTSTTTDYTTFGSTSFTNPVTAPYFAQPGQWKLTEATIKDWEGQITTYTGQQLSGFSGVPSLTIVNSGPVDDTAPTVLAGKVLTPTVSQSSPDASFQVALDVSDSGSGVTQAFVYVEAPGASYGQTEQSFLAAAVKSGTVDAYAPVYGYQPTGTWSIFGYEACDVAHNCFIDENSADIATLFGHTTFTVTK